MNKLRVFWESLRSSLWFLPSLFVLGAVVLALSLIEAESWFDGNGFEDNWPRLLGAGADGARGMLSAIAGSIITVAGVSFSIIIVALTLASSQYTPRILRNFMRDKGNQSVLGVFLGVFAYCLVVLRTIRGGDEGAFVPSFAVLVAVVLAFVALGFFIFFIHHISSALQASTIIEAAAQETIETVDRLFPTKLGEAADSYLSSRVLPADEQWRSISARRTGYIQSVDGDALLGLAREWNGVIRMEAGIGEFVVEGAPLVSIVGEIISACDMELKLNAAYSINRHRTTFQDAGFGVRQIVDIALKGLSPGINDTTTAVICVDYLTAILARLAARQVETPFRTDGGQLRVVARGATFRGLLGEAFDQIRQNSQGNVAVLARLIHGLNVIAGFTQDEERGRALRLHADLVLDTAERSVFSAYDRAAIREMSGRAKPYANISRGQATFNRDLEHG
jgi:uncharacterized membrane protein